MSYVDPTSGDDDAALQGSNGKDVASFTDISVTNNSTVLPVTPVSPPRNLVATANGKTSISLAWDPPVRNGGSPITGYSVQRSASDTGPWVLVTDEGGGTADTTFEDSGLSPGTTYYYRLGAINAIGGTLTSETVTGTAVSKIASATTLANDAATGQPSISGTAAVGQMLTATTSGITDPDGNTKAENGDAGYAYTYQWVQVDGGTETEISGETSSTYTPSSSDGGKTIKVKVSFTDDLGSAEGPLTSDATAAVPVVTVAVSIAADHDRIGAGLEDLDFTLTRQGAATAALEATVTIVQAESWLGTSDLSHTVSFTAGSATATLTLAASRFSFDPETSGDLTATVSGTGIAGGEATVEMVSTADPPITISYDKSSYTFAEDATDVNIYVVATLDPAYPRAPTRSFNIALSTESGTATFLEDFVPVTWQPEFVHGDFAPDASGFVARKRLQHDDGAYFGVENDEVYEGSERLSIRMEFAPSSTADLMQFARPNGDTCEAASCSPIVEYPVFITDEEDLPVLSLGAEPVSISEADDDTTTNVAENVSTLTVAIDNGKTFAADQTVTLTFGGTAVYGVSPVDADANATGHQVLLPAETASVQVTVTAVDNASVDGGRTIEVAGSLDGTEFDRASIAVADDERANTAPEFVNGASADREVAENTAAGTDIGAPVRATDPENDTLEYTLEGTDAASFDIDPDTGQLQTKTGVDYDHEAKSSYSVTVAVNDGYGGTDTIAVTVNVTDVAEKPARPATPVVTAKPGTTDSLNVSWTKPDLAGGPEIVGYKVRHRVTGQGDWTELTPDPTDTMATILGLQSGTGYSVQVQAKNGETLSDWSQAGTGTTTTNTAATGQPGISGTAAVGQTLTATTSGITDPDGKTKAENGDAGYAYTYQWVQVDGGTETEISGETSSTYTPSSSDGGKTIKVKVSFTDDLGSAEGPLTSDATAAVPVVTVAVSIAADHDRIGAGLEDLAFTLTRQGAATAALEATVTIVQDRSWLGTSDLSHTVSFTAGSATATLTLAASRFSFDPDTSGDLTATVSGTGIAGGEATVEMVSTADPPITVSYDKSSYTFAENAAAVEIYVVATLDPAYPRAPSRSFYIALSTESDTAISNQDFAPFQWGPQFVQGDYELDGNRYVARKRVRDNDGTYFGVENDDVYEGPEGLVVTIARAPSLPSGLAQFARPNGDTCESSSCSPTVEYPVTITDEEDRPVLSLSADPASISEADDSGTTNVAENVSVLTVAAASPKTFATGQTVTLTFGGSAVYGTHYGVSPADADANATGHQVLLPAETASVQVTVTAADNASVDGGRTIEVAGSLDGTVFDRASIAVADDERANTAPEFVNGASADREVAENTAAGTDIGAPVRATDPENDTLEYTLEGTDAASFDIDPDTGQLRTKTGVDYDHEAKSSYSVTVAVKDGYGGTDTIAVTVNVTDVAEKPARPATPVVTAKPGTTDSLNVSWTKPDLAGGPEIVGYKVRHRVTGQGDWTELTPDPTDTMATIPGLQSGTGYSVQVQAKNGETLSDWSQAGTGTPGTNTAAMGQPGISGTAAVGQTLTATTSGISDADGKTKAENGDAGYAYTYQWVQVDGGTENDISGETSSTYTPSSSDVGKTIRVRVSFTDDLDNAEGPFTSDKTAAVTVVTVAVSIVADPVRIGAGLEDLDFTLTRQGATTAALEATVTIVQDRSWLGTSDLSHTVTFTAGSATATLTLAASRFSFDPDTSGDLTATVSGTGIAGGEATVEMVSTADPPITVSYDKSSYTFAENAAAVNIYVVATLDPAYPRAPSRSFYIALSTESDTAISNQDFAPFQWGPQFVQGDYELDGNRYVARKRVRDNDGTYFGVENDDVYEGPEGLVVTIARAPSLPSGLAQFARPNGDTCESSSCSPTVEYPVTITDEEDRPVLSLSADPASISEADDSGTTNVAENVSVLTVAAASPKTFATGQTVTLTFGGSAVYGTHYGVSPVDADANATGHQVLLPAETASVQVTVTAVDNSDVDGGRTIEVAGSLDGTVFDRASIAVADDERANTAPEFVNGASADREVAENTAAGTDIGAPVRATDPENDTLEYTLEGTDAASFDIDPDTGQLQTKTGVNYDHEAKSSYSVTVAVNDGYGGTDTIAVTVGVTDEDEPPLAPAAPGVAKVRGSVTSLKVTWRAPDNAGRPPIAHYNLRYRESGTGAGGWREWPDDETGTSATIANLTENTQYDVQVRASNDDGNGPWSAPRDGTPGVEEGRWGDLRLVGGRTADEGRLEVFYRREWGTVCDDRFASETFTLYGPDNTSQSDDQIVRNVAPQLACQLMGHDTGEVVSRGHLGMSVAPASQRIWLDDVRCAEGSMPPDGLHKQCYHAGVGLQNCTHAEDVHLRCFDQEEVRGALTAEFLQVPESHTGEEFRFRIAFSEPVDLQAQDLVDGPLVVTGALSLLAANVDGRADLWQVTVRPDAAQNVSIGLESGHACDHSRAVCTRDGRSLSEPVSVTVPAGTSTATATATAVAGGPLTARFANLPDEHDGESAFTLEIVFSEAPSGTPSRGLKNRTLRNALSVTGGAVTRVRKVNHVPAHRIVTVQPAGREAVDIELPASPDCGAAGAICTAAGDGLETALLTRVRGPAALSVADAEVHEGPGAVLAFAVTLDRAASAAVRVDYATSDGTAQAGSDYTAATGSLTFAPGETAKTVSVTVLDDSHDEGSETLTLRLSNPSGAYLADGVATGTIENTDAMPQAWIARFGRTVADQVLDAVDARLRASRTAGMSVSLAGQRIGLAAPKSGAESGAESGSDPNPASLFGGTAAEDAGETARLKALSDWLKQETAENDRPDGWSRTLTGREVLMGSSFSLAAQTEGGGFAGLWGRMAQTRFAGREGALSLDGDVTTGLVGADYASGRWTTGLVVSHSIGGGGYRGEGSGDIEASMTALTPWAGYAVTEWLSVWGAAGYGAGELKLTPEGQAALKTDLGMTLAAAGARGTLIDGDGPKLDAVTDARWVRTTTARVSSSASDGGNLASASAEVTRLRLGLEGSWPLALDEGTFGKGATVTPRLALGVRHDGGDAETGFGADIGGGVALAAPAHGLTLSLEGRGVLTHETAGLRDRGVAGTLAWNPPPAGRGPQLTLTLSIGAGASGGADALLSRTTLEGLAANDDGAGGDDELKSRRLELKFGYGLSAFGDRFTWTPEVGVDLSDTGRDYSLGWRLVRGAGSGGGSLDLSFEATRRESANDDTPPVHEVGLRLTARF